MAIFRQKTFSEYEAMRSLMVELQRRYGPDLKRRVNIIDQSALIPVLRGNNVVIEKFVISTRVFGKDKFRMYLKMGAGIALPNDVRLTGRNVRNSFGKFSISGTGGLSNQNNNQSPGQKNFGNNNKPKNSSGGGYFNSKFTGFDVDVSYDSTELLGDVVKYDKKDRSLVLEFKSINDAINSLDILPFGLSYKIYLLGN